MSDVAGLVAIFALIHVGMNFVLAFTREKAKA